MSDLQLFAFAEHRVRVVMDDTGEPWFVAVDICAALDIANARDAVSRLAQDEVRVGPVATADGSGRTLPTNLVDEAGVYRLVFTSRRPEAETFRRWVTREVLPAIRRTGAYGVATPDLSTPAGVLAMAEQLTATARALVAASEKVAELEPKAEVADRLLTADGDMSVADAAKALTRAGITVGANRLFAVLEKWSWVFRAKGDGRWRVKQAAIETGYMSVLPQSHYHPRTGVLVLDPPQPRLTPKGLTRLLAEHGVDKAEAPQVAAQMVLGADA